MEKKGGREIAREKDLLKVFSGNLEVKLFNLGIWPAKPLGLALCRGQIKKRAWLKEATLLKHVCYLTLAQHVSALKPRASLHIWHLSQKQMILVLNNYS